MTQLLFPLQFKRQYSGDLDPDKVFDTESALNSYLTDPVRFAGQIVSCLEREGELFILNNSKTAWISFSPTEASQTDEDITSTIAVGGISSGTTIPSGTSFEDIFKNILTPYQTSRLLTFNVNLIPTSTIYEVGTTVSIGAGAFTYTNDSNNVAPHDFSILGTGFSTNKYQVSPILSNLSTYQFTDVSTKSWVLSALNSQNNATNTLTFSRSSQWKIYFGGLSTFSITTLQQSKLNAGLSTTWVTTSDNSSSLNYTYIVYPSSFGNINNIILNGAAPVFTAFSKLANVNYTNSYGITTSYCVYKSTAPGAYSIGSTLTIS